MLEQLPLPFADLRPPSGEESLRSILLSGRKIPYIVRRARRRTIGLSIDHRGLRVGAPLRAGIGEIEALIRRHGDWVLQKIDEWRDRCPPAPLPVEDGMSLPYLGETLRLTLAHGCKGSHEGRRGRGTHALWNPGPPPALTLFLKPGADPRAALEHAFRAHARSYFAERLHCLAATMDCVPPPLALSAARTRWGSCSRASGIRLNWRLIHLPPRLIDYVVVHELAHLREMNHSPRFWAVVAAACPDYRELRGELRQLGNGLPYW